MGQVVGDSQVQSEPAVFGKHDNNGTGVYGETHGFADDNEAGVYGVNTGGGPGVRGVANVMGPGVKGTSLFTGVEGVSSGTDNDHAVGVSGTTRGRAERGAAGVRGDGRGNAPGVWGKGSTGVYGQGGRGPGVRGEGGRGYGGEFESENSSQLRLKPRSAEFSGETPSGQPQPVLPAFARAGELRLVKDDQGACSLWLCVREGGTGLEESFSSWAQVLLGDPFPGSIVV